MEKRNSYVTRSGRTSSRTKINYNPYSRTRKTVPVMAEQEQIRTQQAEIQQLRNALAEQQRIAANNGQQQQTTSCYDSEMNWLHNNNTTLNSTLKYWWRSKRTTQRYIKRNNEMRMLKKHKV